MSSIDLQQHRPFQTLFWRVQRLVWIIFALVLLAALLGLLGAGGSMSESVIQARVAELSVPRVSRWQTMDRLSATARSDGAFSLTLNQDFLALYRVEALSPEPSRQRATNAGLQLLYDLSAGGQIVVEVEPRRPALGRRVSLRVEDETIAFRAWVLP